MPETLIADPASYYAQRCDALNRQVGCLVGLLSQTMGRSQLEALAVLADRAAVAAPSSEQEYRGLASLLRDRAALCPF